MENTPIKWINKLKNSLFLKQLPIERNGQFFFGSVLFLLFITALPIRGLCQVNLSTGRAKVDIPLYSYSNPNNRLSLNISLHYQGGGVKVEEVASNVGLGWLLEYGGYIKRIQRDKPDDAYPNGILYDNYNHLSSCPTINGFNVIKKCNKSVYVGKDNFDREHDLFEFNFGGKTGTFIVGSNGDIMTLVTSNLKIKKYDSDLSASDIITRINKFEIITDNGIKYIFSDKEYNESYTYAPGYIQGGTYIPCLQSPGKPDIIKATPTGKYVVNTWRLTDIINPFTNQTIHFIYETYSLDFTYSSFGYKSYKNDNPNDVTELYGGMRFTGVLKRIKQISFPESKSVIFHYDQSRERGDLPGDRVLKEIGVRYDGMKKYSYVFGYQYFSLNRLKDYDTQSGYDPYLRLCLASLRKTNGGLSLSPYMFEYYIGESVPDYVPPRNFSSNNVPNGRDHWGYYNGRPDNDVSREPNIEYTVNGSLKRITYPTKGSLTFKYEANQAVDDAGQLHTVGGIRVKEIAIDDNINIDNTQYVDYHYLLPNGKSSGYGYEHPEYEKTVNLFMAIPNGGSYQFVIPEQSVAFGLNIIGTLSNGHTKGFALNKAVPGLIKNLMLNFIIHTVIDIFSSDYNEKILSFTTISTKMNTSGNPLLAGYSRTEVVRRNSNGENLGRVVYEFSSDKDVPYLYPTLPQSYPKVQRRAGWLYGLPKEISVYNSKDNLIKQTINIYHYIQNTSSDYSYASKKCAISQSLTTDIDGFNTYRNRIGFFATEYSPVIGRAQLIKTITRSFDAANNYIESSVRYEYAPDIYLLKKEITTNTKGETIKKRIYYPTDYTLSGAIQTMKDHNMLAFPISSETWVKKANDDPKIIKGTIMDYQIIGNGDVRPVNVYDFQNSQPVTQNEIGIFDPATLVRNTNYFKKDASLIYNTQGNLIQKYSHGRAVSNFYGYNNRYLIAQVENASNSEIAYTSFETNEKGNWQYSGIPIPDNPTVIRAVTGEKYYDLSNGALTKPIQGLTNGKKYKLSYWTRNNSVSHLNYSSTSIKGETVQGWTYFQHLFTAGSSNVVLSGTGLIDEVRLYPEDAQMATTTYSPLIGKTSECDADNKLRYYEYDELGRLLLVRNKNRDIIQKVIYHDAGQVTSNAVYYNQAKSQSFTKNDCSSGYIGSSVTYTVPANKYLSTIGIEYANAQAQADIDANGQAYANAHGTCIAPDLTISQKAGSNETRPFSIKVTNADTQSIVFDDSFSPFGQALPFSISLPSGGGPFRVEMDAMNPITVSINGIQKVINGTQSWLFVSAPITIEVWFNP